MSGYPPEALVCSLYTGEHKSITVEIIDVETFLGCRDFEVVDGLGIRSLEFRCFLTPLTPAAKLFLEEAR